LRLSRDCDKEEVRRAYVRLTRRYPPEYFPQRFKRIKWAYDELILEPGSIEAIVTHLAQAEEPAEAFAIMLGESGTELEKQSEELSRPDCLELTPVLDADRYGEELAEVLERIGEEHPLSG
jgi:hypothetical protein